MRITSAGWCGNCRALVSRMSVSNTGSSPREGQASVMLRFPPGKPPGGRAASGHCREAGSVLSELRRGEQEHALVAGRVREPQERDLGKRCGECRVAVADLGHEQAVGVQMVG